MFGTLSGVLCREVLETIILCFYLGGSPIESSAVIKVGLLPQIVYCTSTYVHLQSLVHSMLAEQLNSSGWQERLAACQMFPRLYGGINKVGPTYLSSLYCTLYGVYALCMNNCR